jgi:choline-sulfatase
MADRPNILLLVTDQHRGDCLGIEDHPVLQTPHLDALASAGARFRHAYSACPVCIPARRTLMTGQRPARHGVLMNYNTSLRGPTLPGELGRAGYQTHLVGKLHLWPHRKLYGFHSADWADSAQAGEDNDYQRFLRREGIHSPGASSAHGVNSNSWVARPWHLAEHLHFSNWCADRALEFLDRRDPTLPFFLKVSFIHPHQPCTPPRDYWDRYMDMKLPDPVVGDWARFTDRPVRGLSAFDSWRWWPDPEQIRQFRAGYYGCINHIDDQIGRILRVTPPNTVVVFTADHGEMAGDHQWLRKRNAWEPSARIPFLVRFPAGAGVRPGQVRSEPVELMDVMPTLLDAAGASVPGTVDGASLMPLLRDEPVAWREFVHGECSSVPTLHSGMQYVTDGRRKYVWLPGRGEEFYFDLETDPQELHNLAADSGRSEEIVCWRDRLVRVLDVRPEGFVTGTSLRRLDGPTPSCLPGFEAPARGTRTTD